MTRSSEVKKIELPAEAYAMAAHVGFSEDELSGKSSIVHSSDFQNYASC